MLIVLRSIAINYRCGVKIGARYTISSAQFSLLLFGVTEKRLSLFIEVTNIYHTDALVSGDSDV